jgi:transposase-like protein
MSSFRNIKITCPACSTEGSYTVWDSVNVDLDPELKVKVMDGSLFTWTCPNCKKSFNAPYISSIPNEYVNGLIYKEQLEEVVNGMIGLAK